MDQETRGDRGIGENLSQVDRATSDNTRNSVEGVVFETVIVIDSEENACASRESGELGAKFDELGSSKSLVEASERVMDQEACGGQGIGEKLSQVDQGNNGNSNNSVDGVVFETVIVINSEEHACSSGENGLLEVKGNELEPSKVLDEKPERKVTAAGKEKESCMMNMKCVGGGGFKENWDGERVCRICHLSSDQWLENAASGDDAAATTDLIHLGCGCKDELGIAHIHCAEVWFKLKGNRLCEICGETAKNIMGVGDNRFFEEWNEQRFTGSSSGSLERGGGCWRGQPFCNFLMACLVIAFVLPWFFRANMF